ncbi:MAG TPA: hypothetical protein VG265_13455 [Gaiellaceae bacterium]|jgi:hypothetical protein|nr:hypothetical protein [Gaiellaceae bacterium]
MSESLRNPQLEPADHCYTVIGDHGPNGGGWGPVAIAIPPMIPRPAPFVYTGRDPVVLRELEVAARRIAQESGMPVRLVRFTAREDVAVFGGSS